MGFQFVHMEVYSRKGKTGRGTDWVFDEASRAEVLTHVEHPKEPEVVYGHSVNEIRAKHDAMADQATTVNSAGKEKRIRKDQNTLVAIVISHPATVEEVEANPELAREVADWERRNRDWLLAEYGDQLEGISRHTDEPYWHLHAYVIPRSPEMKAAELHPGFVAKAESRALLEAQGHDAKAVKKLSNKAYRDAMKAFQDRYWDMVGAPSGLTRLGPGRRRLSGEGWKAEKDAAKAAAKTAQQAADAEARLADAEARLAAAEARLAAVEAREKVAKRTIRKAEKTSMESLEKAAKKLSEAEAQADEIIRAAEKIREDAERLKERSRKFGGKLHNFFEAVKGANVEEEIAARVEDAKVEIEDKASRTVARLRADVEMHKGIIAELKAKEIKRDLGFDDEVERRAALRAREIIENQRPQNDVGNRHP